MGLKPMNCPATSSSTGRAALLPRPADPLLRAGPGPPPRAERDAPRPPARASHHPGRRPHLLHRGADPGGGAALPRLRLRDLRRVRVRAAARAVHPPREARRHRGDVGQRRGGASSARSRTAGLEYELNEGDGAFYGPKIDLHMTDSIGRSWQLGTVQLDYYMPERFELTYTGADNADHRPVMIHRALLGSFERFIGILIEHYAGEFPLWLAPVQALVLPIADRHVDYAREVAAQLAAPGCAPRWTSAPSRSGRRSARPSCARRRTCSSWATPRRRRERSPCAGTARATGEPAARRADRRAT